MKHKDSLPDIAEQQEYSGAGEWTDIGEAEITETIFGRAKVHIIHHDKKHRATWLTAMVLTAIVATVWLGWKAPKPAAQMQSIDIPLSINAKAPATAPTSRTEHLPPHALNISPRLPLQTGSKQPTISQKIGTQQPQVLPVAGQTTLPVTNNSASLNNTGMPMRNKLSSPIRPQSATVAKSPAMQHAASNPAIVDPLPAPMTQEGIAPIERQ